VILRSEDLFLPDVFKSSKVKLANMQRNFTADIFWWWSCRTKCRINTGCSCRKKITTKITSLNSREARSFHAVIKKNCR